MLFLHELFHRPYFVSFAMLYFDYCINFFFVVLCMLLLSLLWMHHLLVCATVLKVIPINNNNNNLPAHFVYNANTWLFLSSRCALPTNKYNYGHRKLKIYIYIVDSH